MGIAGIALLGAIYCFIRLITTSTKYFYWKRIGIPGTALIGSQKGITPKRKGKKVISTDYIYDLTVIWGTNQHSTLYTETVSKDRSSNLVPGGQFPILWIEKEDRYIDVPSIKATIKECLITLPICLLVFIACVWVVSILPK